MEYESLSKIYYKRPAEYNKTYAERFNSPLTRHFNFQTQEYNHRNTYPAFFLLHERIYFAYRENLQEARRLIASLASRTNSGIGAIHSIKRRRQSSSN